MNEGMQNGTYNRKILTEQNAKNILIRCQLGQICDEHFTNETITQLVEKREKNRHIKLE